MTSLLLIGHGKMGSAMLTSWQKTSVHGVSNFYVISPSHSAGDIFFSSLEKFLGNIKPDVIVFAVKPQNLAEVLPEYQKRFGISPLYISIAAGKTIEFFERHLGNDAKIIRAMPNTPALVGKAMTALCANKNISEADKKLSYALMQSFGKILWVEEKYMDVVTAISGSGPAYVFLFLEALTKAGVRAGLDENTAKILAVETVYGTMHLAVEKNDSFETLRSKVTSKGGTTEAALNVLTDKGIFEKLISDAVSAAVAKAKDLAN